jgi:hypothetical protein
MLTAIGSGPTIVICAETDLLLSATEVAVTVTVVPAGIAEGAVYVTAPASALVPKAPQAPGLPQVTAHVTAPFPPVVELANVAAAAIATEAFTASDVGGGEIKTTPVGSGGGGEGGDWPPCEPPPQPASVTITSKPAHPTTLVSRPALGRLIARPFFGLIHSIRHRGSNAGQQRWFTS